MHRESSIKRFHEHGEEARSIQPGYVPGMVVRFLPAVLSHDAPAKRPSPSAQPGARARARDLIAD